jgi:hypothetical protein
VGVSGGKKYVPVQSKVAAIFKARTGGGYGVDWWMCFFFPSKYALYFLFSLKSWCLTCFNPFI